jgi:hypothetical protein
VDNEDKGVTKRDTLGGIQKMSIINNKSGSYGLILSTNPSATMWTRKTIGSRNATPSVEGRKVIFINKGRTDSGLPWR